MSSITPKPSENTDNRHLVCSSWLGSVFSSGILGRKEWWIVNAKKGEMLTLEKLEWSKDLVNQLGVMHRTGEIVRRKIYRDAPYCKQRGSFTKCQNISVPNEKAQPLRAVGAEGSTKGEI